MPELDFRAPRLFVDAPLREGERIALERNQSNYLGNVLRLSAGENILVFNGRDGEWQAQIEGRKRPDGLSIIARTRPQDRLPDIAYVFAPLKHARLDYMVQKAVEMGASALQPVLTRHTQVSRVNVERMRANVIEAAEQCGILSLAEVAEPVALDRFLEKREASRLLVFCDEAADIGNPIEALQQGVTAADGIDVLIGPEGGFAEEERALLAAAAQDAAAVIGPPHPARGYRRRRRAGAGAGRAGGLAGAGLANGGLTIKPPAINSVGQSLSKRRAGHAKACANEALGTPRDPKRTLEPGFPDIWTLK